MARTDRAGAAVSALAAPIGLASTTWAILPVTCQGSPLDTPGRGADTTSERSVEGGRDAAGPSRRQCVDKVRVPKQTVVASASALLVGAAPQAGGGTHRAGLFLGGAGATVAQAADQVGGPDVVEEAIEQGL